MTSARASRIVARLLQLLATFVVPSYANGFSSARCRAESVYSTIGSQSPDSLLVVWRLGQTCFQSPHYGNDRADTFVVSYRALEDGEEDNNNKDWVQVRHGLWDLYDRCQTPDIWAYLHTHEKGARSHQYSIRLSNLRSGTAYNVRVALESSTTGALSTWTDVVWSENETSIVADANAARLFTDPAPPRNSSCFTTIAPLHPDLCAPRLIFGGGLRKPFATLIDLFSSAGIIDLSSRDRLFDQNLPPNTQEFSTHIAVRASEKASRDNLGEWTTVARSPSLSPVHTTSTHRISTTFPNAIVVIGVEEPASNFWFGLPGKQHKDTPCKDKGECARFQAFYPCSCIEKWTDCVNEEYDESRKVITFSSFGKSGYKSEVATKKWIDCIERFPVGSHRANSLRYQIAPRDGAATSYHTEPATAALINVLLVEGYELNKDLFLVTDKELRKDAVGWFAGLVEKVAPQTAALKSFQEVVKKNKEKNAFSNVLSDFVHFPPKQLDHDTRRLINAILRPWTARLALYGVDPRDVDPFFNDAWKGPELDDSVDLDPSVREWQLPFS